MDDDAKRGDRQRDPARRRFLDYPLVLMVIGAVAVIAAWIGSIIAVGKVDTPRLSPLILLEGAFVIACAVAAYWLFCRYAERAPMRDFARHRSGAELLAGFVGGALIFAAVIGAAAAVGVYRIEGEGDPATLWVSLAFLALVPGFTEEILFRGILFRFIERAGGSGIALAVTSLFFGLAHIFNPNATIFSSLAIALEAGLVLGAVYMLTRRLWAVIGGHAAWNFTQGWIFGVPVSGGEAEGLIRSSRSGPELLTGGDFGLEASLIALVVATAAGIAILLVAIRRGRWVPMRAQRKE
ncbi:MAG TPA: type II CAAX endopeptidase family protein [Allosphingosinicella sp.]|nr:type II CAAX endopeptidase family protein [Allosphingosinicella sp.]